MTSALVALPDPHRPGLLRARVTVGADGRATPVAATPAGARVTLVWPADQLALHALQLPAVAPSRLRAALCGALEERLLDDPDQLQLALGPADPNAPTRLVASCALAPLRAWLRQAASDGLSVAAVVPEPALLQTGEARLDRDGGRLRLLWRRDDGEAAWLHPDPEQGWPVPGWTPSRLLHDPAEADAAARIAPPGVERQALDPAHWLARARQADWELRQFALAPQAALHSGWQALLQRAREPAWRPVLGLTLAWLVIQLLGLNASALQLRWQQHVLQRQIQQVAAAALPDQPLLDPDLQLRRAVDAQRRRVGLAAAGDPDALLGVAAQLVPGTASLSRLRWRDGQLELQLDPTVAAAAAAHCRERADVRCSSDGATLKLEAR